MYAIEFKTRIRNGIIEIPEMYQKKFKKSVTVIILTEEGSNTSPDIIEKLLDSPIKISNFKPLGRNEIYERG